MGGSLLLLKSIDLGKQEQCFRIAISLPLAAGSIAFGCWKHCFWVLGSIAFGCWEALLLAVGASLLSLLSRFVPFVSFVPVVFFSLFVIIN